MSLRSQKNLKLVGAVGAVALAIGTVAAPALAAGSTASVAYTCQTQFGPVHPSAVYHVKKAPAKMAVGQPLATTSTFTLDAGTTLLAQGLGWSKFSGTIKTKSSASRAGLHLKFPKTTLGNGTAGTTDAAATGVTIAGTKTGTFTFKLGDLGKVVLNGFDSSGNPGNPPTVTFPDKASGNGKCLNDAGSTTLTSGGNPVTVKIVKDTTKTTETAKYSSKTHVAHGKAKVRSHFGTPATGTVKFILKKGTKILKTAKDTLNKKGVASVSFKHVTAKGKYSITGKYTGSSTLKRSSGKATFTV
jgi:hypothetical protein